MTKLPILKKKKCSYLYKIFCVCLNTVSKLKWGEILQNLPVVSTRPDPSNVFGTKQTCLPCAYFIFTSGMAPNILMEVFEDYIITLFSLFGQSGFCLVFILLSKKRFSVKRLTRNWGIWSIAKILKSTGFIYATSLQYIFSIVIKFS